MTDWNNKKEVLEAVREDGHALKRASEELKADKDVVMAAVKDLKETSALAEIKDVLV